MSEAFKLNGNRDIAPCVSAMLSCIAHPNEVGDTITKLSALTFVQVRPHFNSHTWITCLQGWCDVIFDLFHVALTAYSPLAQSVETPALSIMVPLLIRGMRHGETPIKRKTCVIIANMSKLVNSPKDATVFLPRCVGPGGSRGWE